MRSQTHVVHYVKRPGYGRRSFSIMRRTRSPSGEITTQTLTHERLAAINDQLVAGVLSRASADLAVVQICDELNAEAKKRERGVWVASEDNLNLLNAYFEKPIDREWVMFARADNLGGKTYELIRDFAVAGRSVFFGVRYQER